VAVSDAEEALMIGECKWSVNPVGVDVLDDLRRKVRVLEVVGTWKQVSYVLFARSEYTPVLRDRAAAEAVRLVGVEEMVGSGQ
jgi:uncharacterized protein